MKKLFIALAFSSVFMVAGTANAYCGQNSKAAQYYSGQISLDEYLDSMPGVPKKAPPSTTIYHSNGGYTHIKPGAYGNGMIYHSNGSRSSYSTDR